MGSTSVSSSEGPRSGAPRWRELPEDFEVEEVPLFPPSGQGEHTFLEIEKRLLTTEQIARQLAAAAGVRASEVGYAGRKDRRAVTRQWFSVPRLAPERALELELPGARVLQAVPHPHKLSAGQLRGNRFRIVVRGVEAGELERARERWQTAEREGLPNRFGAQRFGRDGRNAERGADLLRGRIRWRDRRTARLMVSALQSAVFNAVLDARPWGLGRLVEGDVACVHRSGGAFVVRDPEAEQPRADRFEISATGPMFGRKMRRAEGEVRQLEERILGDFGFSPEELGPPPFRVSGERRPLRIPLAGGSWHEEEDRVELAVELPPGSYASVLVETLFPGAEEVRDDPADRPPGG